MPVYYSTSEEEHPVFHVVDDCMDGTQIAYPKKRLKGRGLCEECLLRLREGVQPIAAKGEPK